jgi:hypothetical protein
MNQKKLFGTLGVTGAALLLVAIVVSIITFEDGVFSPLSGFYSELGLYPGGYITASSALIFNVGMMLFGLIFCTFMVFWGIQQNSWVFGAVSFCGIVTGALAVAQSVFTLDFARYHYIAATAFSAAVFVFGAAYIIASLVTSQNRNISAILVAFFTAASSAVYTGFMITGGMMQVFVEDASLVGRLSFMPFAVIGWLSLLLIMALLVLLSVDVLMDRQMARFAGLAEKIRRNARDIEF